MKKYILGSLLTAILTLSCSSVKFITVNVEKPASLTIPSSVRNIVIVNNTGVQPADIGHFTLKGIDDEEKVEVSSDSLNIILTQALAQFMDEESFFDKVIPYDLPLRENASFLSEELLDSAKVVSILKETNTDALISLDRLILRSVYRSSNIGNSLISERIDVFVDTRFRFYSSDNVNLSIPVSFSDTVYGEAFRQGRYYLDDQKLPSRKEALRMAILHTADRMVYKFVPYWQDQERWYYTDANTRMREADVKASDNDWRGAAIIWGEVYETEKSKGKQARLALNIALANEMIDDVENALTWACISENLFIEDGERKNKEHIESLKLYIKELQQRIDDFEILDVQNPEK